MPEKCLVTGGCGRLGTELARDLVSRGHTVLSVDVATPQNPIEGVTYHNGDIRIPEHIDRLCDGVDTIFHLAAVGRNASGDLIRDVNIEGTANLVEAASIAEVKKLVFASSCDVYGPVPDRSPCPEDAPLYSAEPFSLSKVVGEEMCLDMGASNKTKVSVIRMPTILGPGMDDSFLLNWVVSRAVSHQPIFIPSHANGRQHYVDITDCAHAFTLSAESEVTGGMCFNIGYDKAYTLEQFAKTVIRSARSFSVTVSIPPSVLDIAFRIMKMVGSDPGELGFLEGFSDDSVFDTTRIKTVTGWRPEKNLSLTIHDFMRWYRRKLMRESSLQTCS